MHHKLLTQHALFCIAEKGQAESAFHGACHTSSELVLWKVPLPPVVMPFKLLGTSTICLGIIRVSKQGA